MDRRLAPLGLALLLALGAEARADGAAGTPSVTFLEGEAGRKAIVDESVEPYFSLLQPIEMAAKTKASLEGADLAAQRADCRRLYQEAVIAVTDEEKKAVTALVTRVHGAWASQYPLLAKTAWSFIPLADTIEGGLPHTRGSSIVLQQAVLHMMVRAAKKPEDPITPEMLGLLAHEQSHVVQRLHPEMFARLYTGAWGYVRAKDVASHPWLDRQHLGNPDGIDVGWVFPLKEDGATTYIQPLVVFSEGPEPRSMPQDFQAIGVTMEKKGDAFRPKEDGERPLFRDLGTLPAYQDLWGGVGETFHPNEIFACLFAGMVVKDHFKGPGLERPSEAAGKDFARLRSWCRENFSGKAALAPK